MQLWSDITLEVPTEFEGKGHESTLAALTDAERAVLAAPVTMHNRRAHRSSPLHFEIVNTSLPSFTSSTHISTTAAQKHAPKA